MDRRVRLALVLVRASLLVPILLPIAAPQAQEAVAEVNVEGSVGYSYSKFSDEVKVTLQGLDVSGRLNLPIWSFVGASVSLDAGWPRAEVDISALIPPDTFLVPSSFSCSHSQWSAAGQLFVRDPSLGRVRTTYRQGRVPSGCGYSTSTGEIDDNLTISTYGVDAEYYLPNWTLAAGAFRSTKRDSYVDWFTGEEFDVRMSENRYSVGGSFYPTNEWRIGVDVVRIAGDTDQTSYGGSVSYQPPQLGNRVSGALIYSYVENTSTIGFRVTLYFGPQPDLKTRDRYYR